MYNLMRFKPDGSCREITSLSGVLSWSSNIDALGVQLDFETSADIEPGDLVLLKNSGREILRTVIVEMAMAGFSPAKVVAFDFAFYLNKSKGIYQFRNMKASDAILQMLADYDVPVGSVPELPVLISHIYYEKEISEIIRDILDQVADKTGVKYRMEMAAGKFYVVKPTDFVIDVKFQLADNLGFTDITAAAGNPSRKLSIEDMRNSIKVVAAGNESGEVIAEIADAGNVSKYGLLQEVVEVDAENLAQAKNVAENKLTELNRVMENCSFECPGNDDVRAGRVIRVEETVTGMTGLYEVQSCVHSLNDGIHKMQLELEAL